MELTILTQELRQIILTTAEQAAKYALIEAGINKPEITKADAYRRYSRRTVDKWVSAGLITLVKRGKKSFVNSLEIDSLAKSIYLTNYHLQRIETGK